MEHDHDFGRVRALLADPREPALEELAELVARRSQEPRWREQITPYILDHLRARFEPREQLRLPTPLERLYLEQLRPVFRQALAPARQREDMRALLDGIFEIAREHPSLQGLIAILVRCVPPKIDAPPARDYEVTPPTPEQLERWRALTDEISERVHQLEGARWAPMDPELVHEYFLWCARRADHWQPRRASLIRALTASPRPGPALDELVGLAIELIEEGGALHEELFDDVTPRCSDEALARRLRALDAMLAYGASIGHPDLHARHAHRLTEAVAQLPPEAYAELLGYLRERGARWLQLPEPEREA